jgi:hypothetical protein
MKVVSLHSKLKTLLGNGTIAIRSNPEHGHLFAGEGAYFFSDEKVEILPDYVGPAPDGSDLRFDVPHDIAWAPSTRTVLAYAESDTGEFEMMPEPLRKKVAAFNQKKNTTVN